MGRRSYSDSTCTCTGEDAVGDCGICTMYMILRMILRKLDVWTTDFLVNINLKEECSSEHLFLIYYKLFLFPGTVKVYFKFCRECCIFARDELLLRALPCSCMLEKTFIVIYFGMSFNPAAVLIQTDMWWGVGRLSEATGRFPGAGAKISVYPLPGSSVLQTLTHSHIVSLYCKLFL